MFKVETAVFVAAIKCRLVFEQFKATKQLIELDDMELAGQNKLHAEIVALMSVDWNAGKLIW